MANGLRVATDAIQTVDTVSLGIWVDVGTRHEPAAINGAAHFLEHMAFKGTERRSARAIAEEIEAVGGHLNAYTSRESTAYYAKVLKEDVPLALDILADILQHSTFDPEELERERTVILQEIGQANDTPDDIIFDHFQECAYPDQAMGRPVLGQPGDHPRAARAMRWSPICATITARTGWCWRRPEISTTSSFVDLADTLLSRAAGRALGHAPSRRAMPAATGARTAISSSSTSCSASPGWRSAIPDYYAASVLVDRVRRRHVVPAVSGNSREAGPGLRDPLLCPRLSRRRLVRDLCRDRRGRGGRTRAGAVRRGDEARRTG